jgi:hypothetical protein
MVYIPHGTPEGCRIDFASPAQSCELAAARSSGLFPIGDGSKHECETLSGVLLPMFIAGCIVAAIEAVSPYEGVMVPQI